MTDTVNSREIEERVVAMRFDNDQFEKGTKQTLSTLEKLKSSLNFTGAAKGFQNIASDANIVTKNINELGKGVNAIKSEFDSLSVIGATCLVNITNAAIRAGKNIVNALSLEPVKTGLQEYETKIGSIQTILTNTSSKGTTLQEVTDALDELNLYADKTIYNFTEMTRNIGRFTAAGVELKTATDAIQGIANLAAASGSTSQQASTAMYQLSQALSSGSLKLQDWNSVVNAGMGGTLFQEALKETARELGKGTEMDDAIKKYGSFRESLREGWITAEVLTTTLNKFTTQGAKAYGEQMQKNGKYTEEQNKKLQDQANMMEAAATEVKTFTALWDTLKETAQSGWTQTWELIIGDYDEAKKLFTKFNNVISPWLDRMAQTRNDFVEKVMGSPSKWDDIVKKFEKAGIGIETINKAMQETFIKRGIVHSAEEYNKLLEEANGDYSTLLRNSGMTWVGIREGLLRAIRDSKEYSETTMTATQKLEKFQKVVTDVWRGDYGNQDPDTRKKALEAEGYEYERVQRLVNLVTEAKNGEVLTMKDLTAEDLRSLGLTEQEIKAYQKLQEEIKDADSTLTEWIKTVNKATGRELLIDSIFNIGTAISKLADTVKSAWVEVFGKAKSDDVYSLIEKFNQFTKSLILTSDRAKDVKNAFITLFNAIEIVRYTMSTGFRLALQILQSFLKGMGLDISGLLQGLADGTTKLRDFIKEVDAVPLIMEHIGPTIEKLGSLVGKLINLIKNPEGFSGFTDAIVNGLLNLSEKCPPIISKALTKVASLFNKELTGKIGDLNFSKIGDNIKEAYEKAKSVSFTELVTDVLINDDAMNEAEGKVNGLLSKIVSPIKNFFVKVLEKVKKIYNKVKEYLELNMDPGTILSAALIVSVMKFGEAVAGVIGGLDTPLRALTAMFKSITSTFTAIKTYIANINARQTARNFLTISGGLLTIAYAIKLIADIKMADLIVAGSVLLVMGVIIGLIASLMAKAAVLKVGEHATIMPLLSAVAIAAALIMMAKSVAELAKIPAADLERATSVMGKILLWYAGLSTVIGVISVTNYSASANAKTGGAIGTALIGMGAALLLMATTLKIAGSVDDGVLRRALTFITVAGAVLTIFAGVLSLTMRKNVAALTGLGTGGGLILMVVAMGIMVSVVKKASEVTDGQVNQAVTVIAKMSLLIAGMIAVSKIGGRLGSGLALIGMVTAMMMIVPLIKSINKLDETELKKAGAVILGMILIMGLFSLFAKDYGRSGVGNVSSSSKYAGNIGFMLMEMAVALIALTAVIAILGSMNEEKLGKGTTAVMAIIGMLALLTAASKVAGDARFTLSALGTTAIIMAALVVAFSVITKDKFEQGIRGVAAVGFIITLMIAACKATENAKTGAIAALLLGFGVIVLMLAILITNLNDITAKNPDGAIDSITAAAILMLTVSACITLMSKSMNRKIQLPSMGKVGAMFASLLVIMGLLAVLMDTLAKHFSFDMTPDKMGQIAGSLILAALMLLICSVAMHLIAKYVLPNLKASNGGWGEIARAGAMIGGLMVAVGLAALLVKIVDSSGIQPNAQLWHRLGMVLAVTAVVLAMAAFISAIVGKFTIGNGADLAKIGVATAGVIAIAVLITAFLDNIMANSAFEVTADMWKKLGMLGTVTFAVVALAWVCSIAAKLLSGSNWGDMGKFGTAISVVTGIAFMIATYIMPVLSYFTKPEGLIEKAAALCIILAGVALVAAFLGLVQDKIFSKVDVSKIGNLATEGGALLVVMAVASIVAHEVMPAFNDIQPNGIIDKSLGLCAILLSLALVCLILGAIAGIPGGSTAMALGATVITGMIGAIGLIMEALIENFNTMIAPDLPKTGEYISEFGDHMKKFGDDMKSMDSVAITNLDNVIQLLTDLPSLVRAMDDLDYADKGRKDGGSWLSDLSVRLNSIARLCVGFSKILQEGNISKESIEAAKMVVDMYNTIWQLLPSLSTGDKKSNEALKDFGQFGDDLVKMADSVISFADKIKTISSKLSVEDTKAFKDTMTPLMDLQKDLYGTGGKWQKIFGEKEFGGFGDDLENFVITMGRIYGVISGKNMYDERGFKLSSSGADWSDPKWGQFATVASTLISAMSQIPASGGLIGLILGGQDFAGFATAMPLFASGLEECYKVVSIDNWNTYEAKRFADAFKIVAKGIDEGVPEEGGWIAKLAGRGTQDWEKFGKGLQEIGTGMGVFAKAIYDDTDMFKDAKATYCIQQFKEAMDEMPTADEWQTIIGAFDVIASAGTGKDWTSLGKIISSIAGSLSESEVDKTYTSSTALQLLVSALDSASNLNFSNIEKFSDSLATIGQDTVSGFIAQFDNSYYRVDESIGGFLNAAYLYFDKFRRNLGDLASRLKTDAKDFLDETQRKGENVANNVLRFLDTLVSNMKGKYDKFFEAGQYVVDGFILGMRSKADATRKEVESAADMIVTTFSNKMVIESPSKVMYQLGSYVGEGLANGIYGSITSVHDAALAMADNTTFTLSDMITQTIAAFDDTNVNPTITPVLDLSEIQNGSGMLNGLFSGYSVGIARTLTTVNRGATNEDVINTLNGLNDTLGNISGDTYNVNGITYDDGSNVASAVSQLISAAQIARRT